MSRDLRMLGRQIRHEFAVLRGTPIVIILAVGFPLLFFALISAFVGNETLDERSGVRVAQFLAPAFASFGIVMATFSFLGVGLAEARARGVVKRQNGTPLPRWVMLGGRMGAAMLLGLASTVLVLGVGAVFYDIQILGRTLLAALVTIVTASLAFSALGIAVAALASTPQVAQALTNGLVIPLAFVSDIFNFGGSAMPSWLSNIGWAFPLKHLVNALGDAFNPFLAGSGFAWGHLAVIAGWGVAGAVAAGWLLRASRETAARRSGAVGRAPAGDRSPRRNARPSAWALVLDQVRHTAAGLVREFEAVFFSVAFPILLVVLIPATSGGGGAVLDNGLALPTFLAGTMAIYGAAVTGFVSIAEGIADERGSGALTRTHGTPLPRWALLTGRVVGAVVVSLVTVAGCYLAAAVVHGAPFPVAWPAILFVVVLAAICFAALGLAVVSLVRSAQSVIGISLGFLLPLSFLSDVFIVGVQYPAALEAVSWVFPLRHATASITEAALLPTLVGGLDPGHLGMLVLWTLVALLVVAWRFAWEGTKARARLRPVG
ncbi:ABC transporter permease [Actinotalea sp.]|uniref:ABC transporter permease n=1 Tax=Actinotalea sp. TaxID=1872145 RepID=UPI0035626E68